MPKRAILIAGPTASGKSGLAIKLAKALDGVIINADALQVYAQWQVLTARPDLDELQAAPHLLYGHVGSDQPYSVGHWLKDVSLALDDTDKTSIIVGGTGLYFSALTDGLSEIPEIPSDIRQRGNELRLASGTAGFLDHLIRHDPDSLNRLDQKNPVRLQRAWEVLEASGHGLAYWHARPKRPLLPLENALPFTLSWHPNTLNLRIDQRFDQMMQLGAISECEAALARGFDPNLPSSRAIGAREIIEALDGNTTLQEAVNKAKILTHQYAKRQRSWFRSRMKNWVSVELPGEEALDNVVQSASTHFS